MDTYWLLKISPCLRFAGDSPTPSHWLETLRVIYENDLTIFDGCDCEVEIEGEKHACPAGSFLIIPPAQRHLSRELSGRTGRRYWAHFDWVYAGDPAERPTASYFPAEPDSSKFTRVPDFVPQEVLHGNVRSMRNALELFRRLQELSYSSSRREWLQSRSCLLELLLDLLTPDDAGPVGKSSRSRTASQTRAVLAELASLPAREQPSLQAALAEAGPSYAHQCRVFKEQYGISPLQYVAELRMTRVKSLLRDTSLGVSQIADMEGFDNLAYFSELFRKHAGMTPSAFRQAQRSGK